jgi:2C-methyl-D-erythritol 2,4-cyclodiphosphate synthase
MLVITKKQTKNLRNFDLRISNIDSKILSSKSKISKMQKSIKDEKKKIAGYKISKTNVKAGKRLRISIINYK